MFGFRVLLFIVAYVVVLAEMIVGSGATRPVQGAPWIVPGALVLTLLIFVSNFMLANLDLPADQRATPTPVNWITMVIAGGAIAASAFYFPNYILPWLKPLMMQ